MDRVPAQRFEDLEVWQKSHQLTLRIYKLTATLPKHELYGLTSQMRRAAVSVLSNIAEGFKKRSKPDKARVLNLHKRRSRKFVTTSSWLTTSTAWMLDRRRLTRSPECSRRTSGRFSLHPEFCLLSPVS